MITKIYVSSEDSLVNGRRNWAIPKERGDFLFTALDGGREEIEIRNGESCVADFRFSSLGPHFPLTTALFPASLRQYAAGRSYHTHFSGSGWGRLARVEQMAVDPAVFPDIAGRKPFLVIKAESFRLHFPKAQLAPVQ